MCVHENVNSPEFIALAGVMRDRYGLEALTLVRNDRNFSMFVTPNDIERIQRAAHDLRTWHPDGMNVYSYGFSDASAERLLGVYCYGRHLDELEPLYGRNVPDSLDLDEKDPEAVYNRCVENGYVASVTVS